MTSISSTRTGAGLLLGLTVILAVRGATAAVAAERAQTGAASWYGEDHRGLLMANGRPFDPDRLTAASWFYPLGTKLRVEVSVQVSRAATERRAVLVTVTDRGPARELVAKGRVIDLSLAAFRHLKSPRQGLVAVSVRPIRKVER